MARCLLLLAALLAPGLASAAQVVTLGLLAYQSPETLAVKYRPLLDYLSAHLGGTPVRLDVLGADALAEAVANHRVDLVLTTPSQYLALRSKNSLSGALATLARQQDGHVTQSIGGVIVVAADRDDLQRLTDLSGRRIGVPMLAALGGFQAPALELRAAGVDISPVDVRVGGSTAKTPSRAELRMLGTEEAIVGAVLSGDVDAGLLRTGTLEALARDGKLDLSRLRVLNRQQLGDFPWVSSTRLYPDWPLAALPTLDPALTRRITAALLALEPDHPTLRGTGLAGFGPPADYSAVEELARNLRLPPYDAAPSLSWREFILQHRGQGIAAGLGTAMVIALLVLSAIGNRRLREGEAARSRLVAELQALLSATPYPMFEMDGEGRVLRSWLPNVRTTTVDTQRLIGHKVSVTLPAAAATAIMQGLDEAARHGRVQDVQFALPSPEGERWFAMSAGRIAGDDDPPRFAVQVRNITAERQAERELRIAASVFTHAGEGVLISGPDSRILAVNQAFRTILGYTDDDPLIGTYTRDLRIVYDQNESFATLRDSLDRYGAWEGELHGERPSGERYVAALNVNVVRDEAGNATHNVAILTDITQLKSHQRELEHIAYHDALTGLPNRALLADRLQQAMARASRHRQRVAVVYVDLDGFKAVNDTHGHDQGDALLIAVAQSMRRVLRGEDTLARIGGDEFVAVLGDLADDAAVGTSLQRLLSAASEPVSLAAGQARVSASLGVTFFPQDEATDADQLLRQADHALYQAKLAGKNRYHVYDAARDQAVRSRHEALEEIRAGLRDGQFVLHYQPKVNLHTGAVVGAEALVRWQHPRRGLLAPAQFLPLIENHRLGVELGEWVIDSALHQAAQWEQAGVPLPISVNVSADHLQQADFAARLRAMLGMHAGTGPLRLEIEILESGALADLDRVATVMRDCAELGVTFALDDFGTGYSSLLYLKHLPAGTLKIDSGFVRHLLHDADNLPILEGVLTLARGFGRTAVAEGIETVEQGTVLLQLGCEFGQGYVIARPMPAADLPAWIDGWQVPAAWQTAFAVTRERLPLLMGDVEHRAWIQGIADWLHGTRGQPQTVGAHAGRFGSWLRREGRSLYGTSSAFRAIDGIHTEMHELADRLVQLHTDGRTAQALDGLPQLWTLLERMRGQFGGLVTGFDEGEIDPRAGPDVPTERLSPP
jgi:diguanylate cyclase (GGDEF)-like protein/PAS domain S-box-containing protein